MVVLITWRPRDDHGTEDLDELERRAHKHPIHEDGTRRYYIGDADLGAFTSMLDQIDTDWHEHLQTWCQGPTAAARLPRA